MGLGQVPGRLTQGRVGRVEVPHRGYGVLAAGPDGGDALAGLPAPETLRRLAHAVVGHQDGPPADDATLMLVQWSTPAALNTVPKANQREDDPPS